MYLQSNISACHVRSWSSQSSCCPYPPPPHLHCLPLFSYPPLRDGGGERQLVVWAAACRGSIRGGGRRPRRRRPDAPARVRDGGWPHRHRQPAAANLGGGGAVRRGGVWRGGRSARRQRPAASTSVRGGGWPWRGRQPTTVASRVRRQCAIDSRFARHIRLAVRALRTEPPCPRN